MLIAYLPTSGIQNPGQIFKIPWILPNFPIQSIYYLFIYKNVALEYGVKMEDTNYQILGRRTRVRMNESQYSYDALHKSTLKLII